MKITKTAYVKSFANQDGIETHYPNQIAFAGRSNVGKSSILNSLLNRKNLAKTSSTPGKTQMVNVFSINDTFHFVDLPGFGYAKVSRSMKKSWKGLVETFLVDNPNMRGMVLIIDVRRGLQDEELAFTEWLELQNIPTLLVVNKIDKLKKQALAKQLTQIKKTLETELPKEKGIKVIPYSAKTKAGKSILWREIHNLLETDSNPFLILNPSSG